MRTIPIGPAKLRLSVVLATYNGARYLPAQLQSLLLQHRLPDELIISDDASQDKTIDQARAFAAKAPFAVHIHRQPTNLGSNQNFGAALAAATGDVLFCCDQDDVWHPDKLSSIARVFENDPEVGFVMNNADLVDADLQPMATTLWDQYKFSKMAQDMLESVDAYSVFETLMPIYGCTTAVRADLREFFLPIPQGINFDVWIGDVAAIRTECRLVRRSLQQYRQHASQVTGFEQGTLSQRVWRLVKRSDTPAMTKEIDRTTIVLRHLSSLPDSPKRTAAEKLVRDRQQLAIDRLAARRSLVWRVPLIVRCLLNGSYHRSGRGVLSAALDLVSKPERFIR